MFIIITGGLGFIGSHLAEHFSKKGHLICIMDSFNVQHFTFQKIHRGSKGLQDINEIEYKHRLQAYHYRRNLGQRSQYHRLWSYELEFWPMKTPDLIINCGSLAEAVLSQHYNRFCFDSIVKGAEKIKKFFPKVPTIHFSSSMVYGTWDDSITEESRIHPVDWYGTCKAKSELTFKRKRDIVLRPIHVFSFGDGKYPLPMNIERQVVADKPVKIEYADCIYIKDLVSLIDKIVENFQPGTYNISAEYRREASLVQQYAKEILNIPIEVENKLGPTGEPRGMLDSSKVKKTFKWEPQYLTYEEAIKDYFEEFISIT